MFTRLISHLLGDVNCCPWVGHAYGHKAPAKRVHAPFLYSPAERRRRDESPWTMVQGVLAPVQFLVFLASA
jgi:3-vinyl bacteriochlorophyllide hydratase